MVPGLRAQPLMSDQKHICDQGGGLGLWPGARVGAAVRTRAQSVTRDTTQHVKDQGSE